MLRPTSSASCRASVRARAAPDPAEPVSAGEFADLVARFCPVAKGAPVAVAVSGGGDSMALALLADAWGQASGHAIHALTVDHGLRADSRAEAETVGRWLTGRGIRHDILAWTGDKPATAVQAAARAARYRLMGTWAEAHGIRYLMLGHQREDQAETFLMRCARGSGIAGLAAMRSAGELGGLHLCRPLLTVPRARLRATLAAAGQDWIEDPSNDSPRFARTGYRRLAAALDERGIGAERLAGLADAFARLDALIDAAGRRFLGAAAIRRHDGSVALDRGAYGALPEAVAAAVLRRLLAEVSGGAPVPRSDRLARARQRLVSGEPNLAFTLGYCRIAADGGTIRISRESGRTPPDSGSFRGLSHRL